MWSVRFGGILVGCEERLRQSSTANYVATKQCENRTSQNSSARMCVHVKRHHHFTISITMKFDSFWALFGSFPYFFLHSSRGQRCGHTQAALHTRRRYIKRPLRKTTTDNCGSDRFFALLILSTNCTVYSAHFATRCAANTLEHL